MSNQSKHQSPVIDADRRANRMHGFGTTIFSEMTMLAVQHQAINLGQGFPDFAGPEWVKQAAAMAIAADHNQYAPSSGVPRLRAAIATEWERRGWRTIDPEVEITVTSGATEALFAAMQALVNPGDEVICFEPFYDAYVPDILLAGGVPRFVCLRPPVVAANTSAADSYSGDWWFDPAELAAAFTSRTRIILVNTPHNPTGKVFCRNELQQIAHLCQQYDVMALCDEVYDRLVYDGREHLPLATLPEMWQRTLTINSTGKTFSLTGWKVGYVVGPPHLMRALRQAHQWITFASATPLQEALATAFEQAAHNGYYAQLRADYVARRDLLAEVLRVAGLPALPVAGSYFLLADIGGTGFTDDVAFCRWLTSEIGVAAIPPSAFYARAYGLETVAHDRPLLARFCFAKRLETIQAAGDRLRSLRTLTVPPPGVSAQ